MPAIDLEIGTDGDVQSIVNYTGGASVEACLQDAVDDNYAFSASPGTTSLWYPAAHGLAVGTTINSLTLHFRGCGNISGGTVYGYYKRQGDGAASNTTAVITGIYMPNWTDRSEAIPAPVGGWDLTKLENCQFGINLVGGGTVGTRAHGTKVFLRVDYTPPATAAGQVMISDD
ncbi:MAG: hypothetical protein ACYDCO_01755 [Armatimonadota bacterium]